MIDLLNGLDVYGWAVQFSLVLLRTSGLFLFLPIFGSDILPLRVRLSAAFVVAIVFVPLAPQISTPPTGAVEWVLAGGRELTAGLGLGITARVLFAAIEAAAQIVAGQSGFALATMVDPNSGDQSVAPAMLMNLLAMALFLAADLHHLFIMGFHASYELLPPAAAMPSAEGLDVAVGALGMRLFTTAIQLAAPALLVSVTVDLVMVLVGKAMPQVPILIVGYPFKMGIGLVTIGMLIVSTGGAIRWIGRTLTSDGAALLSLLGGR